MRLLTSLSADGVHTWCDQRLLTPAFECSAKDALGFPYIGDESKKLAPSSSAQSTTCARVRRSGARAHRTYSTSPADNRNCQSGIAERCVSMSNAATGLLADVLTRNRATRR